MKLIEKLAKEYVLNEVDPSQQVGMAPDDLCAMCFKAGFRKAKELFIEEFGWVEAGNREREMWKLGESEVE